MMAPLGGGFAVTSSARWWTNDGPRLVRAVFVLINHINETPARLLLHVLQESHQNIV